MKYDDMIMVHRFLDGELSSEELLLFEKKIADSSEVAAYLEDLRSLDKECGSFHIVRAPEVSLTRGFIPAMENFFGKQISLPAWPAFAAGSMMIILFILLSLNNWIPQRKISPSLLIQEPASYSSMRLVYFSKEARSVSVVGNFNDWREEVPLSNRNGSGYWVAELKVRPGEYHYSFVIDGEARVTDVTADFTLEDDYGSENSVLRVGL